MSPWASSLKLRQAALGKLVRIQCNRASYSVTGVRGGERSTHMLAVSVDACLDVLAVVAVRERGARSFRCTESDPNILMRSIVCGAASCARQHDVRTDML